MPRLRMSPPMLATPNRAVALTPAMQPKQTKDFYGTQDWKTARGEVVRERGNVCQACGRVDGRMFVDHIVELNDGGAPFDKSNLQVLCGSCHTAKTRRRVAR